LTIGRGAHKGSVVRVSIPVQHHAEARLLNNGPCGAGRRPQDSARLASVGVSRPQIQRPRDPRQERVGVLLLFERPLERLHRLVLPQDGCPGPKTVPYAAISKCSASCAAAMSAASFTSASASRSITYSSSLRIPLTASHVRTFGFSSNNSKIWSSRVDVGPGFLEMRLSRINYPFSAPRVRPRTMPP